MTPQRLRGLLDALAGEDRVERRGERGTAGEWGAVGEWETDDVDDVDVDEVWSIVHEAGLGEAA